MTPNDAFVLFKRLDDEIQACEVPLNAYLNYRLTDPRKIKIYQDLIDSGVDVEKFFLANLTLNREFFIDFYKYNPDRCMTLYYSFDEFLVKKRKEYFMRVIQELKKKPKLDLEDRDAFLAMAPVTDPFLFSVIYPEEGMLDLLLSLDNDWVKFNLPEYKSQMEYIRKIIRGNLVMKRMKGYDKLRQQALKVITK